MFLWPKVTFFEQILFLQSWNHRFTGHTRQDTYLVIFRFISIFVNLQNIFCSHGSNVTSVTICTIVSQQVAPPPPPPPRHCLLTAVNDIAPDYFYKLSNHGLENISPLTLFFLSIYLYNWNEKDLRNINVYSKLSSRWV